MKYFISIWFNLITGLAFIIFPYIVSCSNFIVGASYGILCWMLLDYNVYIQKKLNYINNLFIKI